MALERWDNLPCKSKGFNYYLRLFGWVSWVFIIGVFLYRVNLYFSRPPVVYAPAQSSPFVQSVPIQSVPVQSVYYKTYEEMCAANPSSSSCLENSPIRTQMEKQALLISQQSEKEKSQLVSTVGGGYSGYVEINGKRHSVYEPAVMSQTFKYRSVNNVKHLDVEINGMPFEVILDTGASYVALNSDAIRKLGVKEFVGTGVHHTANGDVKVNYFYVSSLRLGSFEVKDVKCGNSPSNVHNLLGGSFLKHFDYSINESSGTITFTPK
ncbi:MAG: retroviral-like aspartic protease family protein [Nitrospirae bacterium]|nr:retroviral-like aspartic protease family protein [Nitrospirota bacterium]